MTMRNQNVIRRDFVGINVFGQLIAGDKGIKQEGFVGDLRCKARMSVVSNLHIPSPLRVIQAKQESFASSQYPWGRVRRQSPKPNLTAVSKAKRDPWQRHT